MIKVLGVDVSVYQKGMNLSKAKNEGVRRKPYPYEWQWPVGVWNIF